MVLSVAPTNLIHFEDFFPIITTNVVALAMTLSRHILFFFSSMPCQQTSYGSDFNILLLFFPIKFHFYLGIGLFP